MYNCYYWVSQYLEASPELPLGNTYMNQDHGKNDQNKEKKEKEIKIIVNGTEHTVPDNVVTFEEVVEIAFPGHPNNPDIVFSVTFEKADSKPHQGTLAAGGKVTVRKHGTVFDVTQTNRS